MNSRGRPEKEKPFKKVLFANSSDLDYRLITPEAALALFKSMSERLWTYKRLADLLNKPKAEAMQIMNDLVHYGLVKFIGKQGKISVFERFMNETEPF
jgi:hypothetical protein